MKSLVSLFVAATLAVNALAQAPLVQSNQLRRVLTRSALQAHGKKLQQFADASSGTRAFGTKGHNATVDYVVDLLKKTGYYDVETQAFPFTYSQGTVNFTAADKEYSALYFTFGPAGAVTAELANVADLGCVPENYPADIKGKIALISRGTCPFGLKVALAGAAGASGVIIYNNIPGEINGTLGDPSRPEGPYVPAASISGEDGPPLVAAVAAGTVVGTLSVNAFTETRISSNVIATTKTGDKNNIVFAGAHSDSVPEGPGINDNGSGSIGILEIALQLPKWSVKNAVRFAWWTAEEFGLVGSEYYVTNLPAEEQAKIALYLNFDMIASPNFAYFVYDGDGNAFNITGPPGSDHIEHLYESYFTEVGIASRPTEFSGRSDYGPFLEVGIPSGGLFTGAEGIKTAAEAALWGGEAGVAYDVNYHKVGDTLKNTNLGAWIQNTKAAAHSIATYARDLEGIPRGPGVKRREVKMPRKPHGMKVACNHVIHDI